MSLVPSVQITPNLPNLAPAATPHEPRYAPTLNKGSTYNLASDIQTRRKSFDYAVIRWSIAVFITTLLLLAALGYIYYTLFLARAAGSSSNPAGVHDAVAAGLTISWKILLLVPFVFALYFTTSNYGKARKYRDKYIGKEIVAKSLPAYIRLLRQEFPESSAERLAFALHNMQSIYDDPNPPKKRSYNIGVNKIFRLGFQEDDTQTAQDKVIEGTTKLVKTSTASSK